MNCEQTLKTESGRPVRVAVLVYNDAQNDARVLKESASAQHAGAEVKIFAVSNEKNERFPGTVTIRGLETERVPEFMWADVLPGPVTTYLKRTVGVSWEKDAVTRTNQVNNTVPSAPQAIARPSSVKSRVLTGARKLVIEVARRSYGPARLSNWWLRILPRIREFAPDLIHANDANSLLPATLLGQTYGIPVVYDSHELWLHRNVRQDRWLAPKVEALIESYGIKRASEVITVSGSIAVWLKDKYGLSKLPVLVRNVPETSATPGGKGKLRTLAGLSGTDVVIGYSGRITTARGIEEALEALPLMPDNTHLVMLGYGDTTYLDSLWNLAAKWGVEDRMHVVGPVASHEVAQALADADVALVHVQPKVLSYRFALPNKLFEAIHAGVPVVASDLPDMSKIVDEWKVGATFDGEDPQDLADAVERVLENKDIYRDAARRAAISLTWENEAAVLIDAYQRALDI